VADKHGNGEFGYFTEISHVAGDRVRKCCWESVSPSVKHAGHRKGGREGDKERCEGIIRGSSVYADVEPGVGHGRQVTGLAPET
jgi:hypothetical protein